MPINSTRLGLARFNESERWKEAGTDAGSGFPDGHNDLVDSYDMLAVETDTHSNRPGTGTYDDELFLSTDRRTLYRWENDSSTWNETAGHGTSANPVSDSVWFEVLNSANVTSATEGQTLQKGASGSDLTFGGGGLWTEDANSPVNSTGAQSATITLDGTYDLVLVQLQEFSDETGSAQAFDVRVDGDSGTNYDFTNAGGTSSSNQNQWAIVGLTANGTTNGQLLFSGDSTDEATIFSQTGRGTTNDLTRGNNDNVTLPLDSITFRGRSGNVTVRAKVYGWTGGL